MKRLLYAMVFVTLLTILSGCSILKKDSKNMSKKIKIVAYNVEFAKATTPKEVAQHLKREDGDIICFSEVPSREWTALVGKELGMEYNYVGRVASANHIKEYRDKSGKFYGKFKSILSKTPLTESHEMLLNGTGWKPVSVVFAKTIVGSYPILIGSLHVPSGKKDPLNSCSANLAKLIQSYKDETIIITGDYNDLANSAPMQPLYKEGFKNSWIVTDFKLKNEKTWDAKSNKNAGVIDHILYRGPLKAIEAEIIKSKTPPSDHYAIKTTFEISNPLVGLKE